MFGDLTTVTMGFSQGDNIVGRNGDDTFSEKADSRSYRLGISQILSKNLIMSLALELITDEGFLKQSLSVCSIFRCEYANTVQLSA